MVNYSGSYSRAVMHTNHSILFLLYKCQIAFLINYLSLYPSYHVSEWTSLLPRSLICDSGSHFTFILKARKVTSKITLALF